MSYHRTANYSAEGRKVCRTLGAHAFTEAGICCSCRIVRDDFDHPYRPMDRPGVDSPRGGTSVALLGERPRA